MPVTIESPRERAERQELGVGELLPYSIDWGAKYLEDGQAVTASTWDDPDGLTVDSSSFDDTSSVVWLEWDLAELPDPIGRTVKITNTTIVDGRETVKAILEIVGVTHTAVQN